MFKKIYILCIAVLLVSCNESGTIKIDDKNAVLIDLSRKDHEISFDSIVSKIQCVPLEIGKTGDFSSLQRIDNVLIVNNIIYALDREFATLKAFNTNGKFLFNFGGVGMADDKFLIGENMVYNPYRKTLWVVCNRPSKIIEYSLDGKFLRKIDMDFYASDVDFVSPNRLFYFVNQNRSQKSENKNLLLVDTNNNVLKKAFDFPLGVSSMLEYTGGIYNVNNKVFFNPPLDPTFYQITENKLTAGYKLNLGKTKSSPSLMDSSFPGTSFLGLKNYIIFNYTQNRHLRLGVFDQKANTVFINDRDLNPVNFLFNSQVIKQNKDTLVLFFNSTPHTQTLLRKNEALVRARFPGVYESLFSQDTSSKQKKIFMLKVTLKNS
jgi:hypothetical protein